LKRIIQEIASFSLQERFKLNEKDFTRKRKQSFLFTIIFISNFIRKSLSIEIENFISYLQTQGDQPKAESFTKSAFVQFRKKINPDVFKHLSSIVADEFYSDNEASVKLWHGFRVLAVDGSRITLPRTKELKEIYGETKSQNINGVIQSRVSVLYDVLNNIVLDGIISTLSVGEGELAKQHLSHTREKDLIIYDRGYPSFDLVYNHNRKNVDYLVRVKTDFSNLTKAFVASGKTSQTADIHPSQNKSYSDKPYDKDSTIKVRLIRIELSSGQIEVLMTSLLDSKKYRQKIFKELYFKRWGVETYYDELKNKLKVEHFSGYSHQTVLQDFYAALFISNIQTIIVNDLEDEIKEVSQNRKYNYKVNNNMAYGLMKDKIISLLFSNPNIEEVDKELKALILKYLIPIRPNRTNVRDNDKYTRRRKPKVLKNQKDTI
jgi:Transposase DDE domain